MLCWQQVSWLVDLLRRCRGFFLKKLHPSISFFKSASEGERIYRCAGWMHLWIMWNESIIASSGHHPPQPPPPPATVEMPMSKQKPVCRNPTEEGKGRVTH